MAEHEKIFSHLISLYGKKSAEIILPQVIKIIDRYREKGYLDAAKEKISEKDAILITYADQILENDQKPLHTLKRFVDHYIFGIIRGVHILPFFPYSSDEGFSVINYYEVNQPFGTWHDVSEIGEHFKLMFDAVINHISSKSEWFHLFLEGEAPYDEYFINADPDVDLSRVVRPRALPLLTKMETKTGQKHIWTTFSSDQIDLNYKNPHVLLEIIDILLFYESMGAQYIRLDAIAFAWKEIGTTCIHLPQTHRLVQLFREVLDKTPQVTSIITETNVPHTENISYFGDGTNEAQLVYNFALPPLVLHAILTGSSRQLNDWAERLEIPSSQATYFNFLASHDGIGLNPARGILSNDEIDELVSHVEDLGGFISYKDNPDGSQSPYELNINYFDALSDPNQQTSEVEQIERFILAHAIMFSVIGVPGIYFHSLVGSKGWLEGVEITGQKRTINRERLKYHKLIEELSDNKSRRSQIYTQLCHLLEIRSSSQAFDPFGSQEVINFDDRVFAYIRTSKNGQQTVICLNNLTGERISIAVKLSWISDKEENQLIDLITKAPPVFNEIGGLILKPYQSYWIEKS